MGTFYTNWSTPARRLSGYKLCLMALFFALGVPFGKTQVAERPNALPGLEQELLPLDTLMALAEQNSPLLDYYEALIDKSGHEVDLARRTWQNNIFGFANYSTGDQRIVTATTGLPGDLETTNLATGYRAGVQINIPLFEFTGRRSRIRLHEAERRAMVSKRNEMHMDLRRIVTEEYYMVLGAFESLKTRSEGREAMKTYYLVAEQEFQDGVISIGELAQVKNALSTADYYYQNAKYDFYRIISAFSVLVGVSTSELTISNENEHESDIDH